MTLRQNQVPFGQQPDLFAKPAISGLASFENCFLPADEQAFINAIDGIDLAPFRFQGWSGKRLTAVFGWRYDFDTGVFAPCAPIPGWLLPLRETVAHLTGLASETFEQVLLIRYGPGAGIGWHRDRPVFEHVVGVSLGAAATMLPRDKQDEKRASIRMRRCRWGVGYPTPQRRGPARLGAQHCPDGGGPLVHYIPHARGPDTAASA